MPDLIIEKFKHIHHVVLGKPAPEMIDGLIDRYKLQRNELLIVGDRLIPIYN
jgi:ribonucleotide monophosphatase NagD (HAD superfamily)